MPKTETATLIGSADAAQALHIDRSTLTRWVKRNKIKPVLTGSGTTGEMFFAPADIEALRPSPSSAAPSVEGGAPSPFVPEDMDEPVEPSTPADWAALNGIFDLPTPSP